MRRRIFVGVVLMLVAGCGVAFGQVVEEKRAETFGERFPWAGELTAGVMALGLIAFFVWLARPGKVWRGGSADFRIVVSEGEVTFRGSFPVAQERTVEEFLLNDCPIEGAYEVTGEWADGRLVVSVRGANAKFLEQRIRNFLKLTVKKAG